MEEVADPKAKARAMKIVKSPEYWDIDEISKKALHITGGKKDAHFSIFGKARKTPGMKLSDAASETIHSLEFGRELEFFKSHGAKKSAKKDASGATVDEYSLPVEEYLLVLNIDPKTSNPKTVKMQKGNEALALQYDKYETLPLKASLFTVPSGLQTTTLTEAELEKKKLELRQMLVKQIEEFKKTHKGGFMPATKPSDAAGKPIAPTAEKKTP